MVDKLFYGSYGFVSFHFKSFSFLAVFSFFLLTDVAK